jgi:hypothetical protein
VRTGQVPHRHIAADRGSDGQAAGQTKRPV